MSWTDSQAPREYDTTLISRDGIHWHPTLEIYVKEERVEILTNVGIGSQYVSRPNYDLRMGMTAVHTHTNLPIIHLEFSGMVREDDIRLKRWFEIWGKDFYEFGPDVAMTVGEVENAEFGNYIMKDGDKIVLRYNN